MYGVLPGLVERKGVKPLRVKELVFFKIDFFGCDPNTGLYVGWKNSIISFEERENYFHLLGQDDFLSIVSSAYYLEPE